jgi:hypothetical protein
MSKVKELSAQQKRFCEGVARGRPKGRAYEEAGYAVKGDYADQGAVKLISRNIKVRDCIAELTKEASKEAKKKSVGHILTIEERKAMLTRISSTNEDEDPNASRQAIAELNKMDGGYEPEKHEVEFIINIGGDAE